ncbi:MAG: MFS transporter [Oscillospiraceae bacterium]
MTTWFTTYVASVMGQGLGGASTCLLIATGGAIVSYIPVGALASKIGRKKTIQLGVLLLAACFALGYVLTTHFSSINAVMFLVFALVGLAWAAINVNSLPMVVEMCRGSDIGKFTGYYYTASMAAQVVTPVLAGTLMQNDQLQNSLPLRGRFCLFVLCHHVLRAPRRRQGGSKNRSFRVRGYRLNQKKAFKCSLYSSSFLRSPHYIFLPCKAGAIIPSGKPSAISASVTGAITTSRKFPKTAFPPSAARSTTAGARSSTCTY